MGEVLQDTCQNHSKLRGRYLVFSCYGPLELTCVTVYKYAREDKHSVECLNHELAGNDHGTGKKACGDQITPPPRSLAY